MTTIPLRDTRVAFIEQGRGEPLVCVHGTLGSMKDFPSQIEFFSRSHRVIAYSRRYHPPNPPDNAGEPYALSVHAADLAELIEELGIAPATVLASSYGGYVALWCATRHPGLIEKLVLGEPPILPLLTKSEEGETARAEFESTSLEPARAAFTAGDDRLGVKKFFDGVSGRPGTFDMLPQTSQAKLMESASVLRHEMLTGREDYMPSIADDQIRAANFPVLLLNGQKSPRFFALITDELERLLPDTYRVVVPGSGHAMHLSNPSFYNETVAEFIAPG